jgi:quinol monooxygenase YgiN
MLNHRSSDSGIPAESHKLGGLVLAALAGVATATRVEGGCLSYQSYRSIRDPRLFYVNSRWCSEEAFELHARLDHTVRFIARAEELADQPIEVTRARLAL